MGTWSPSICGNDTAQDLRMEYSAAFWKYDVEEALARIDEYVRSEMCDESDEEEWCNYYYSLADFMWKKGILTETVKNKAIEMIDSGFGLEIWEYEGQTTLNARKRKLAEFKEKLLSPQPAPKKIKPNVHGRIFEDGDIIAVQLQTEGKPYTEKDRSHLTEEEFHALHGKYVLMQLVECKKDWSSAIVPEIADHWARFRLFYGIYDEIPRSIDSLSLEDASILQSNRISSAFTCESSMFYFKKRKYQLICNRKDLLEELDWKSIERNDGYFMIFWSVDKPWSNPDSEIINSMQKHISCGEFWGTAEQAEKIVYLSNRYRRFDYNKSQEENEARFLTEATTISNQIKKVLSDGGKLYRITFGREIGLVTVQNGRIDNLYIEGQFQQCGFGTKLLEYAFSVAGKEAYIQVPIPNYWLNHICKQRLGLKEIQRERDFICYVPEDSVWLKKT